MFTSCSEVICQQIQALYGFQGSNEEGTLTEMATEFCHVALQRSDKWRPR